MAILRLINPAANGLLDRSKKLTSSLADKLVSSLAPLSLGMSVSFFLAMGTRAIALEVRVMPTNPRLGETLSVVVDTNAGGSVGPTVSMGDETYPTFPIGPRRFRAFLPTTPVQEPGKRVIRVAGEGEVRNIAVWLGDREFPIQSIWLPPGKSDLQVTDYEWDRLTEFKKLITPRKLWNGPFLRPNAGRVASVYGIRRYYNGVFAENYYHSGVDYGAPTGSPIVAPAAGRVALVGYLSNGFELHGNTVGIDHGQGVTTLYLHMSRIDVREGELVQPGQVIGAVGSTGISTGPHLHWGVYVHGKSVDPVPWRFEGFE